MMSPLQVQAMVGTAEFMAPEVVLIIIIISMAPGVIIIIIIIITVIIVIITIIILITIIMASEVVNYEDISLATDQWSLGVLCFILLSGETTPAGLRSDRPYLRL